MTGQCAETGRLNKNGDFEVRTICIDAEVAAQRLPVPAVIKIDVEGAEIEVLNGARRTIIDHKPSLLIAIHGSQALRAVETLLADCEYKYEVQSSADAGMYEIYAQPERTK